MKPDWIPLPGGGAEIFHPEIREQICADKVDADGWLNIHEAAHQLGMHSNATMLYGHIEKYWHRIDHMETRIKENYRMKQAWLQYFHSI